jgi:hypothetical protein
MTNNRKVVESALTFALVSPLLIWAVGCAYLLMSTSAASTLSLGAWLSLYVAMLAFLSLVSAYVVAAGPALVVGAAFGWVHSHHRLSLPAAAVLGLCLGFVAAFSAAFVLARVDGTIFAPPVAAGVVGGLSALVSALLTRRRLGANNSFKPNPLRGSA